MAQIDLVLFILFYFILFVQVLNEPEGREREKKQALCVAFSDLISQQKGMPEC